MAVLFCGVLIVPITFLLLFCYGTEAYDNKQNEQQYVDGTVHHYPKIIISNNLVHL